MGEDVPDAVASHKMVRTLIHDLRNDLTVIAGSVELLEMNGPETVRTRAIKRASEGVTKMTATLNKLSEATR